MPYEIGRTLSDAVLGSVERARDRAAANPARIVRHETRDTGLQQAYLRAQQDEQERALRRELGMAEIDATGRRSDLDRQARLDEARLREEGAMTRAGIDAQQRKDAADVIAGIRTKEAEDRAGRYAARSKYEEGVLKVREAEAAAEAKRAATAAEAESFRRDLSGVRTRQQALDLLLRIKKDGMTPDGRDEKGRPIVTPEKRAQYAALAREAAAMLGYSPEAGGKGMGKQVSEAAGAALRGILGPDAEGFDESLDALDETTGYQDWGG